jgi:predicted nuclease of restriction endonuclease-like (RecB) superfamily
MKITENNFFILVQDIKKLIRNARYNAVTAVNAEMLKAYYEIGKRIVEDEQKGENRAEYGKKLLDEISSELTKEFGRGYSATSLRNMRSFYITYKNRIHQSLTDELYKLTWTHYCELIKIEDEPKRRYFEKYAIAENLSVRDLKRQIYSLHYERLHLSKDKGALIEYERKSNQPDKPEELIKDPYVLEFLNLEENHIYAEKELETQILDDLQKFLLELGQGFSFVARQKRFTIDNDHFYIDLLFYNIYLKCYVVIELKTAKFRHEDAGQMNFYLNYVKKELNKKGDNEPIGIVLCTDKNKVQVEYAISGISNKMFVSKYKLYLPTKEELEREVRRLL